MTDVRYVDVDGRRVAYITFGEGSVDLLYVPSNFLRIEALASGVVQRRLIRPLTSFARVISWDDFGTGMSDPVGSPSEVLSLEAWAAEALGVADATASERFAVFAHGAHGTAMAAHLATEFPARVSHVILLEPSARTIWAPDYELGTDPDALERVYQLVYETWGDATWLRREWSTLTDEEASEVASSLFRAVSPTLARELFRWATELDVREPLGRIACPVLVFHRADGPLTPMARYVADAIPDAQVVELDAKDGPPFCDAAPRIVAEISKLLVGTEHLPAPDHRLRAVLFTDIVSSTSTAASSGDRAWRELLAEHDRVSAEAVRTFSGRRIKSTGDGVLAIFEGATDAISCALTIRDRLERGGLAIRAGVHAGEVVSLGDDVTGLAVTIASRVCDAAAAGQVLVSHAVPPLLAGSGLAFGDRGDHELKGVPGRWALHEVSSATP